MKFKTYTSGTLVGGWEITYKIDGVRLEFKDGRVYTKNGKELFHDFPDLEDGYYELYLGTWEDSVSIIQTTTKKIKVEEDWLYRLSDDCDNRLFVDYVEHPTEEHLKHCLKEAVELGYEGLVLGQEDKLLKFKPDITYDVEIEYMVEGQGKHEGRLGKFGTPLGEVGTGFSDKEREEYFTEDMIGKVIEVKCDKLTSSGKFRFPRFVRMRPDKTR